MLELRIINAGTAMPLFDLPAALGRRRAAREIGDTIEGLIAFMDDLGGDTDLEVNGDELDGNGSEDDFMYHGGYGPGCPVADPGEVDGEDACEAGDDEPRAGPSPMYRAYGWPQTWIGSNDDAEREGEKLAGGSE